MFKLATWNVNSLKVRMDQVLEWFDSSSMDVLALQETKILDEHFPKEVFLEKGYHAVYTGQKTYNGVAIISRHPITDVIAEIPNFNDPQRRLLAVTIAGIRLVNVYVPNGEMLSSTKYLYKLDWLKNLHEFISDHLKEYPKLAIVGDFNIAPQDEDVHDPKDWEGCVLVSPAERKAFADLLSLGLYDSFRNFPQEEKQFSWWDYRAGSFRRNRGLRIDHIVLSEALNGICRQSSIDKGCRSVERPSDHAPVWVALEM